MPLLGGDMEESNIQGSNYSFSAKRIGTLEASEYTLVVLACDVSGSVGPFKQEMEGCIKEVVKACGKSPRADNLMLRFVVFDDSVDEIHGFKPLSECNADDYDNTLTPGGMTALYDASQGAIQSTVQYGKSLTEQDFDCNAIVICITDGMDNRSTLQTSHVKEALAGAVTSESVESMVSILVGVNVGNPQISGYLDGFSKGAGFTQYVEIENADATSLGKLAEFVSSSVSAQSQALGTGGPSQALNF
jgi:uncharacterized protein YegL